MANWTTAHPKLTSAILKTLGGLAAFNISIGAGKILFGNIISVIAGGGSKILTVSKYFKGFSDSFKFLKSMGNGGITSFFRAFTFGTKIDGVTRSIVGLGTKAGGVFKILGKGSLSAVKSVASVGGAFLKTGVKALIAGGKMALAWVIGLGPVGWAIGAITLIIGGAIIAWKTNFLGFRDGVKKVVGAIKGFFGGAVEWISDKLSFITNNPIVKAITGGVKSGFNFIAKVFKGDDDKKTSIVKGGKGAITDNRNITYNINSTDPKLAAQEVSRKNNDKYYNSRDPRLVPAR